MEDYIVIEHNIVCGCVESVGYLLNVHLSHVSTSCGFSIQKLILKNVF